MTSDVWWVVAVAGGLGCAAPGAPARVPAETPTAPPAAEPAAPRSLAAMPSSERADWPCAIDLLASREYLGEVVIEYDGPSACMIPVELVADGITGCPTRLEYVRLDREEVYERVTFDYDVRGQLIRMKSSHTTVAYSWDREGPLGRDTRTSLGAVSHRYVDVDGLQLVTERDDGMTATDIAIRFEDDRPVVVENRVYGLRSTLTWDGGRLRRVDTVGGFEQYLRPIYDCE